MHALISGVSLCSSLSSPLSPSFPLSLPLSRAEVEFPLLTPSLNWSADTRPGDVTDDLSRHAVDQHLPRLGTHLTDPGRLREAEGAPERRVERGQSLRGRSNSVPSAAGLPCPGQ